MQLPTAPFLDPDRRRSLLSLRLWSAAAAALLLAIATGTLPLLWRAVLR